MPKRNPTLERMKRERLAWARSIQPGAFSGGFTLRPIGPEVFTYLPDKGKPFTFRRANGMEICPGTFEYDGASANVLLQLASGVTRHKYYLATPLHDWGFTRKDLSFEETNLALVEAMVTMMKQKMVPANYHDVVNVFHAVSSPVGRRVWDQ